MLNGTGGKSLRVSIAEWSLETPFKKKVLSRCTIKDGSQVFQFPDIVERGYLLANSTLDLFSEFLQDLRVLGERIYDESDETRRLK